MWFIHEGKSGNQSKLIACGQETEVEESMNNNRQVLATKKEETATHPELKSRLARLCCKKWQQPTGK